MRQSFRRNSIKQLVLLAFVVVVSGIVSNLSTSQLAYAWCDNLDINFDNVCVAQNYDSLPDSIKGTTSIDEYKKLAQSCMDGNADGFDIGIRQGGCADAAKSCLEHAVNVSTVCTGDTLANIVARGEGCNSGKLTSNGDNSCTSLKKANQAALDDMEKQAKDKAKASCTVPTTGPEADKTLAREKCLEATSKCTQPTLNNDGTLNAGKQNEYQNCLNNALTSSAKDPAECTGRGGIWVDEANTGNGLTQGCKTQYSDLVTPEACAASGGANRATGAWAQAKDGSWGCHSPDEVCNKPDQWKINDQRPCSQDNIDKVQKPEDADAEGVDGTKDTTVNGQCGAAHTNIISCDGTGAVALNNVLKIVISVLTVLVGIAAVGGLAWASILYAKATDNQASVSEARTLIQNIVIGLLVYVFLLAIVNFLIPGGIFPTK